MIPDGNNSWDNVVIVRLRLMQVRIRVRLLLKKQMREREREKKFKYVHQEVAAVHPVETRSLFYNCRQQLESLRYKHVLYITQQTFWII